MAASVRGSIRRLPRSPREVPARPSAAMVVRVGTEGPSAGAHAPDPQRFCVDGMAIRLGKYLRCLGYDAVWDVRLPTRLLARRAATEGRVLVTRNTRVGDELVVSGALVVLASEDPVRQVRQVMEELGLDARRAFTRCIRCNVALEEVADREAVRERVPAPVFPRHRRYSVCPRCGTVFWLGSHVARTCAKLGVPPPPGTRA